MKDDLNDIGSNSSLFLSLFPRFLHIAVAQGRRALSYVLARKMNALHMLDIKEHNGQVRSLTVKLQSCHGEEKDDQSEYLCVDHFSAPDPESLVNINFELLTLCHHQP